MKKVLIFLTFVLLFTGCKKGDKSYLNSITVKGYTISMDASKLDKEKDGAYFKTSFDIVTKDKYTNTYNITLVDVISKNDNQNDGVIYDFMPPEKLIVNDNELEYYLDDYSVTIYYHMYDEGITLEFEVNSDSIKDKNGNKIKGKPIMNKDVIESREFAKAFKFDVKKN